MTNLPSAKPTRWYLEWANAETRYLDVARSHGVQLTKSESGLAERYWCAPRRRQARNVIPAAQRTSSGMALGSGTLTTGRTEVVVGFDSV
jgi:hypothetical protein